MEDLRAFGKQLGLVHFDRHLWAPKEGIAALRREVESGRARYIPYTNRAMKWHTDGYYNTTANAVRGVIMHCVNPAAEGGANWVLDPEMVYIAMRDADPAYIEALMQPDVMTIPENSLEPGVHRPAVSGPVFSLDRAGGDLQMRYTARTRSIVWKDDALTRDAVAFLEQLLTAPVSFAFRVRLEAGEGIVCNNVLHNREAFSDGADADGRRLLWRARYRDRIAGTSGRQDGDR
jgi:alpha-ketoglutarate-dependent taurine dioxygenase